MTHDPRLPSLEQIMNGNPFELVDSPWGKIEAWRASTLATGTMGALQSVYDLVRSDSAEATARADEAAAQHTLIQHVLDQITEFEKRFDAHVARIAEAEKRARDDAARQARFDEEPVELPPDISAKQTSAPPKNIGDTTHHPSGELHSIDPKEEEQHQSSALPEPPVETESDGHDGEVSDAGGVPLSYAPVPLSYVKGGPKDATSKAGDLPEELEQPVEPPPEHKGGVVPQPIGLFGN
jgi:hypothetical protein